jgi:cytoskeleton protein RodZ
VAGEAGAEELRGIGARLRSAREKRGLTILQAAEKLHVDAHVLEALESEDFASLGAAVYARGHLRRYAELVGESPAELQQLYDDTARAGQPDLTRIPHAAAPASSSRLAGSGVLLLVGVALGGILWWALTTQGRHAQPVPASTAADASTAAVTAGAAAPEAPASELPAALPVSAAASGPPAAGAAPADLPAARGAAHLALKFTAPSWVEVYDAGGHRLLQGVEAADSARTLEGAAPLKVVLGNAPGVALQMNGQAVTLGGLVHRDRSARIVIDGSGHVSAAAPAGAPGG